MTPVTTPHTLSWDKYSFMVDGKRLITWSGEFHYYRLPSPYEWTDVLEKMKAAGFNSVSLYFDWQYHSPKQGVYDFNGVRNIDQLLNIANDLGIYVFVRPGPYINAELDGGGMSSWIEGDAPLRSSSPCVVSGTTACPSYGDYESQALAYMHAVDQSIANHQITNGGGSVVAYQIENETSGNLQYLADLAHQVRADGITVPLFVNNSSLGGVYVPIGAGGTGGTRVFWNNIYGYDNYPQGFNCTSPYTWSSPGNNEASFRGFDTSGPVFIPEFQGGSFDNWGQATYFACNVLTNSQFERVFYLTNAANGTTMESNYMTFGGTTWGWEPPPNVVYSSYDYGSAIAESRILTGKYFTLKELGFMFGSLSPLWATNTNTATPAAALNVSPAASTSCTNGVNGSALTNCGAIRVYNRVNASTPATGTNFYFVNHQEARGTLDSFFQLGPITTADGNYPAIPQYNAAGGTTNPTPSTEINGRDMKLLVADYNLDSSATPQHLVYSTSQVMIDQTVNNQDDVLLWAPTGQTGETDLRYSSRPTVTTLSGTVPNVTWNQDAGSATGSAGDLVLDYTHSGLTEVKITGGGATTPLILMLADEPTAQSFSEQNIASAGAFATPGGPILEQGPELVRTAAVNGSELDLTGDTTTPTNLRVWAPAGVTSVDWNGSPVAVSPNNDGSLSATSQLSGPPTLQLPALNNWQYEYESPEIQPSFNDSQWTLANKNVTNDPTKPPAGQPVLYGDDYGFHHGDLWYRGHFTATAALTQLAVTAESGSQGISEVWLNGTFLGSTSGTGSATTPVTYNVPAGTTNVGGSNVIAVLVRDMGEGESGSSNQPRGLVGVTTTPATAGLAPYQPQSPLAVPAAVGATNLSVLSTTGFAVGQAVTVGGESGHTITAVGSAATAPTSLAAPVAVGATTINVASVSSFTAGQQIAVGTGSTAESATVSAVGTAATAATQLFAPASVGDTNVKVSNAAGFAVGQPIEIGTGANYSAGGAEQATVTSVGSQVRDTDLFLPTVGGGGTAVGATTIHVTSTTGMAAGDQIVIDYRTSNGCSGCSPDGNNQESDTIQSVGNPGANTTLSATTSAGATNIYVGSTNNLFTGDVITIDTGSAQESATIASIGTAASTATTVFTPTTGALTIPAGATNVPVTATTGFTVGQPIGIDSGANEEIRTVTSVGTQGRNTTLSAASALGATNIKVASVTGLTAGDTVIVDTGTNKETATIAVGGVGTAGATGTGLTLTSGLTIAHASGVAVSDPGTGVGFSPALSSAHASGVTAQALGTGVGLTAGLANAHLSGVAISDPGTGIVLTTPLTATHAAAASVIDYGTGISFTPALTMNHGVESAVQALGSGITLSAPLANAHAWASSVFPALGTGISISPGLTSKQSGSAAIVGPTPSSYWMLQGNQGGEDLTDTVRGADNNGGSYGENAGWSLAGYPDSSGNWTHVTLPYSDTKPGIAWYRDTFNLNMPAGVDAPISLDISDVPTKVYHATIFLNGWNVGQYINNVGPQMQYVLPTGLLNPNGSNTVAIEVITTNAGGGPTGGGLGSVQLVGAPNTATYDDTSNAITYGTSSGGGNCTAATSGWTQANASNQNYVGPDINQTETFSGTTGDCFSITFSGTAVRWIASLASNHGIGAVYLDGAFQGNVDGYGPSTRGQHTMFSAYGLANTTHTLTVVNTGAQNAAASGDFLDVDAIDLPPSGLVEGGVGAVPGGPPALLVNSPAYVAPTLSGQALTAAPGGAGVSGTIATVTVPPDALGTALAATISWGDGSQSPGTVTGSGSSYSITGSHTYSTGGVHNVTITLTDQYDGSVLATTTTTTTTDVTTVTTSPGGNVPSTLSISVGSTAPTFGAFTPGQAQTYTASQAATITSTAASATLTAADTNTTCPGYLANTSASGGPYCLSTGLQISATDAAGSTSTGLRDLSVSNPATLLNLNAPVANDPVTIGFQQVITATQPLRTGTYSKTITLTLSTNTP